MGDRGKISATGGTEGSFERVRGGHKGHQGGHIRVATTIGNV